MEISLIFPHQLFLNNPCLDISREVVLIEDPLYFTQLRFHKQKLILHRASMQAYTEYLKGLGYCVRYLIYQALQILFSIACPTLGVMKTRLLSKKPLFTTRC